MFRGELIPDEYVIPKVMEVLHQPQYRSGLIMDGFPRTIRQAEALEQVRLIVTLNVKFAPIDIAIAFSMPKAIVVKKLTRRVLIATAPTFSPPSTKATSTSPHIHPSDRASATTVGLRWWCVRTTTRRSSRADSTSSRSEPNLFWSIIEPRTC